MTRLKQQMADKKRKKMIRLMSRDFSSLSKNEIIIKRKANKKVKISKVSHTETRLEVQKINALFESYRCDTGDKNMTKEQFINWMRMGLAQSAIAS